MHNCVLNVIKNLKRDKQNSSLANSLLSTSDMSQVQRSKKIVFFYNLTIKRRKKEKKKEKKRRQSILLFTEVLRRKSITKKNTIFSRFSSEKVQLNLQNEADLLFEQLGARKKQRRSSASPPLCGESSDGYSFGVMSLA